jgi:hypothetical protein
LDKAFQTARVVFSKRPKTEISLTYLKTNKDSVAKAYRARRVRKASRSQVKFEIQSKEFKFYTKNNGKPWEDFKQRNNKR